MSTTKIIAAFRFWFTAALAVALALGSQPAPAFAAPQVSVAEVTVNIVADEYNTSGSGTGCSVREAVKAMNSGANFGGCTRVNVAGTNDTILLPSTGSGTTYTLSITGASEDADVTGDLDITASMVISMTGVGVPTIRGGSGWNDRVLHFVSGTSQVKRVNLGFGNVGNSGSGGGVRIEPAAVVTLTNLTVGNNVADGNAGGILNRGTLTLTNSTVTENTTNGDTGGGGIYNSPNATLTLNNSTVFSNHATGTRAHGGGIYADEDSAFTINNSTINENDATDSGGGIFSLTRDMLVNHSLIKLNDARYGGGGIIIQSASSGATATIRQSIIRNNAVDGNGGGIMISTGPVLIQDSTISNNSNNEFGGQGDGGGLFVGSGTLGASVSATLVNTTVTGNLSENNGGGIYVTNGATLDLDSVTIAFNTADSDSGGDDGGGGGGGLFRDPLGLFLPTVNIRNTILAGNISNGIPSVDCFGQLQSGGYNLVGDNAGCVLTGGTGDINNANPLLNGLAFNGGPTAGSGAGETVKTLALQFASPAIDKGDPAGCKDQDGVNLVNDERGAGFARALDGNGVGGARCDIGAYEAPAGFAVFVPLALK